MYSCQKCSFTYYRNEMIASELIKIRCSKPKSLMDFHSAHVCLTFCSMTRRQTVVSINQDNLLFRQNEVIYCVASTSQNFQLKYTEQQQQISTKHSRKDVTSIQE